VVVIFKFCWELDLPALLKNPCTHGCSAWSTFWSTFWLAHIR
jgi:hypothetical protein